jgi:hypothetical protein
MRDKIIKDLPQREAARTFQRAGRSNAATEYEKAHDAFRKNYDRLKAERLAYVCKNFCRARIVSPSHLGEATAQPS